MEEENVKVLKLLLVGDSGVGKTSLISRYVGGKFNDNCASTLGVDTKEIVKTINSIKHRIKIIDTTGQEKYQNITTTYFRIADGMFVVFDLNDEDSFKSLEHWINLINELVEEPNIIILANKSDLFETNTINDDQINDFSYQKKIKIIKVSAKENYNIKESFYEMLNLIYDNPVIERDSFVMNKKSHRNSEVNKKCC